MAALPVSREPRLLGKSNLRVTPLGFGLWRFVGADVGAAERRVGGALDLGFDLFDVAAVYGLDWGGKVFGESEALLGRVLRGNPAWRGRMVLATKAGVTPGVPYDTSAGALIQSCEESLKRLRTDVIDLFQIHRPDVLTHPAEVAAALVQLRMDGKIREAGVSNYTAAQAAALQAHLPFPLATHQPEFSALHLAPVFDGVFDQCMEQGLTPLAWSPLAGGRLALPLEEARRARQPGQLVEVIETLDQVAARTGASRIAVALAFVIAHPSGAVPVVGTQSPDRLRAALDAFRVSLTRADWYAVATASLGKPLP